MRISFPTLLTNAIAAMMLAAGALASPSQPAKTPPAPIVTYRIKNFGPEAQQTPITFGAVFVRGDIPAGTTVVAMGESGVFIPLQIDRKATHGDRSLRHAVLTLVIPQLRSGETLPILLRRAAVTPDKRPPVALGDLPMDFDVAVRLTIKGGKHLHATARELLASQSRRHG